MVESTSKKFDCILADPPWEYDNKRTGGSNKSGASQKYDTMPVSEIQFVLPHELLEDDAILFLWTTNSMLPYALMTVDIWGFEYKTMVTWVKRSYGLGYWFRGKTEHLLFGVRGKVEPFKTSLPNVIFSGKTLPHSQKPEQSYELVESCAKLLGESKGKKVNILELFARRQRSNWTCVGKEITGNDIRADLEKISGFNTINVN